MTWGAMYRVVAYWQFKPGDQISNSASQDDTSSYKEVQKSTNQYIGFTQGVKYKRNKCI